MEKNDAENAIRQDTVCLLKECDAGTKMAVGNISYVIDKTEDENLRGLLDKYSDIHKKIGNKTESLLRVKSEEGKDPNFMGKTSSKITTSFRLMKDCSDHQIADLMIDGCSMGIKSVTDYINQYSLASEESKDVARDLIAVERQFVEELNKYL